MEKPAGIANYSLGEILDRVQNDYPNHIWIQELCNRVRDHPDIHYKSTKDYFARLSVHQHQFNEKEKALFDQLSKKHGFTIPPKRR